MTTQRPPSQRRLLLPALMLLLGSAVLVIHTPPVAAQGGYAITYTENFETDTLNAVPEDSWYGTPAGGTSTCTGAVTCRVAAVAAKDGTKGFEMTTTGAAATGWVATGPNAMNLCSGGRITFDLKFASLPAVEMAFASFKGSTVTNGIGEITLIATPAGAIKFSVTSVTASSGTTSLTTTVGSLTVVAGTWYEVVITSSMRCLPIATYGASGSVISVYFVEPDKFTQASITNSWCVYNGASCNADQTTGGGPMKVETLSFYPGSAAAVSFYVDNIVWEQSFVPALSVGAAATVAVTGLVGFDVDFSGANAIARTASGQDVRVYNAQTLVLSGGPTDTDCNRADGITAAMNNIGFLDCDTGAVVQTLELRSPSMGDPLVPQACEDEMEELASWTTGASQQEINTYDVLSIDFEIGSDDGFCVTTAVLAVSTTDGKIFLKVLRSVVLETADENSNVVQYAPLDEAVGQICAAFADGIFYLLAVDSDAQTRAYEWDGDTDNPQISLVSAIGGTLGGAAGIGCGFSPRAIIQGQTVLAGYNFVTGTTDWTITTAAPNSRGATLSADGLWAAAYVGSVVEILNATTGEVLGTITPPSGDFKELRMDATGQNLWIATATTISRYDIHAVTTVVDVPTDIRTPFLDDPDVGSDNDVPAGLFPEPSEDQIALFGTERAVQGFRGLIMLVAGGAVGGVTVGAYSRNTEQKIPVKVVVAVAGVCAVIATVAGWLFGVVEDWFLGLVVFLVVALGVGIGVSKFAGRTD